jgi:hypothetical protein
MIRVRRLLTWLPALLALGIGVGLRDCLLLAASAWFSAAGFRRRMDQDAPFNPLAAALRCISGGIGALLASAALMAMLAAAWLDWWQPANDSPGTVAAVLLALFALMRAGPALPAERLSPLRADVFAPYLVLAAGLATLAAQAQGVQLICCAAATAVAIHLARVGWHLAHAQTAFLLRAAQ